MIFRCKRAAAFVLTAAIVMAALTGCGKEKFDGTKTALTVNGEAVDAGVVSFESHFEAAMFYSYYSAYLGGQGYFDMDAGQDDGTTIGQQSVKSTADSIAEEMILKQHAAEFGAELTDEQKSKIEEVAEAFVTKNPKDVLAKLGVSKDDVILSLTLDTIRSNMLEPMAADVDTEVSDEEAQQTSVTYVSVAEATADAEDGTSAEDQNKQFEEQLNEILAQIKESDDIASADIEEIAKGVNEDFYTLSTYFSTNDDEQESVDKVVADAVKGLTDGQLYDGVLKSEEDGRYFIVRLDKTFDEEATENRKGTILTDRKQALFDETLDGWKEASEIVIDDEVLATIKITDTEPYAFKAEESEEESAEESSEEKN